VPCETPRRNSFPTRSSNCPAICPAFFAHYIADFAAKAVVFLIGAGQPAIECRLKRAISKRPRGHLGARHLASTAKIAVIKAHISPSEGVPAHPPRFCARAPFSHRLQPVGSSDVLYIPVGAGFSRASRRKDSSIRQRGFGVVRFGRKNLPFVAQYIAKQKQHHANGTPPSAGLENADGGTKNRQGPARMAKAPGREARLKPA